MSTDPRSRFETSRPYKAGFVTDIESESVPPGLSEDVIRMISAKKGEPEWMTDWRLKALRHCSTMKEPTWQNVHYAPIDYQAIIYYSAPKSRTDGPKSLDEVDPKLLETYEKLGEAGVIFCSFSEAVRNHPDLVKKYLGSVVPYTDNFFATLNSAVFTDGSF